MLWNAIRLKICDKAVHKWVFFVLDSIHDRYKAQEMCDIVVSENYFLIVCYPDKYKTQGMCDEATDDSLVGLKIASGWII